MKKYFAVADVHGAKLELKDFIDKGFSIDNPNHYIVFNGDNFDRGEHNLEVYHLILDLKEKIGPRLILIRGNHEELMLDFIEDSLYQKSIASPVVPDSVFVLVANGGRTSLSQLFDIENFLVLPDKSKLLEMKDFIESMVLMYETNKYVFTHGGFYEGKPNTWHHKYLYEGNQEYKGKTVVVGHLHLENVEDIDIKKDEKYGFLYAENEGVIDIAGPQPNIAVFEEEVIDDE